MAVKVMMAPAITNGALSKSAARKPAVAKTESAPRPKRRRSAIYDADGNEVFITLVCLKCRKVQPLSQFGLRRMADGSIRNQPWCKACRTGQSEQPEKGARRRKSDSPGTEKSPTPAASPQAPATSAPAERPRTRSVAAEVAAALAGGRG